MHRLSVFLLAVVSLAGTTAASQQPASTRDWLIARGKSLELSTPYVPPPGDAQEHHAAGFAKIMCSAAFITGLSPEFAAENVGYFISPYAERAKVGKPVIDRTGKTASVTLPGGVTRTAKYLGHQGCVILPSGQNAVQFKPVDVKSRLGDPAKQPWPMGDALPSSPLSGGIDVGKVTQAVSAAFDTPEGMTAAFVVTWRGRLVAERYGEGLTHATPLESWSMGKSLTATLMGILIQQGVYQLWQPAPVPEWQGVGDPRAKIRIGDILNMSSGLRIRAPQDPDHDPAGPYPDHLYLYTGPDAFRYAATRNQQWPPATVGRYRNTDPVLINYLVRLGVEKRGEEYLSFPQRALFDKLGVRTMVIETDANGNFLGQGAVFGSGRDWARLGNLYLQDGVWNGERILPEGYARFVSTLAPAWVADRRPVYGGFFWINGGGTFPVLPEAYYMSGAGGQTTLIIPSHELVVVRMGHFKGAGPGGQSFRRALALLMEAVPRRGENRPRQTDADAYTRYELLAPGSAKFRIIYEVTATTAGATHYFNPIRKGSVATDESVIDRATGKPLAFDVVGADVARAGGVQSADSTQMYIRVKLARPVPPDGGEGRVLILKTYEDAASYFTRGDTVMFTRPLGIKRNAVVLPKGYQLLSSNFPSQILQEGDGRIGISFWNPTPAEAPVTLRAVPVSTVPVTPSTVAARLDERAHQNREIVYLLRQPETHAFDLYHDYTESRPGTSTYLNVVRTGSTVSNPRARNLDTGEELTSETLKGEAITRAKLDVREVTPQTEVVVFRFPAVVTGASIRLRMSETYTDSARYKVSGDELVWDRSFGRPANAVVLPTGWMLTNSSIPATVSTLTDGRVRLDFINPRPDEIAVLITARRRST